MIIAISNKHFIANAILGLFGYLLAVLINCLLTISLNIFNLTSAYVNAFNYFTLIFVLIYGVITYAVTYYAGNYLRKKLPAIGDIIPRQIQILLFLEIVSCASIFVCFILLEESGEYPRSIMYSNTILFGILFIITLIIFIICIRILQKNHELIIKQQEKESLEDYMLKMDDMYQNFRIFKHDYMNILYTMKYYIDNDESDNLKEYFQSTILPTSEKLMDNDTILGQLSNIRLLELKGVLYSKLIAAMNQELNITLEIQDEIKSVSMEMLDLSIIIGIFMDNAIEASVDSHMRNLVILIISNPDSVLIIISNSTNDTAIKLDHIYNKDISFKKGHSGLGLYSANRILEKYDNIIHSTNFEDNIFTQKLEICTIS